MRNQHAGTRGVCSGRPAFAGMRGDVGVDEGLRGGDIRLRLRHALSRAQTLVASGGTRAKITPGGDMRRGLLQPPHTAQPILLCADIEHSQGAAIYSFLSFLSIGLAMQDRRHKPTPRTRLLGSLPP